ncbi:MAG: class I SAM-dependent methyltransferase [Bacteroidetes bacterium]|nr:class I SAM-dependent methyltransferase [Bacteroidota bacterium]MDA1119118.1 class I SAM-dependent methyltransferase [Bacteroidota bacterium]
MEEFTIANPPVHFNLLIAKTQEMGFSMRSDELTGSFLRTLTASKPGGRILELGTGTGFALSWIISGMDEKTSVTSIDNDPEVLAVATQYFGADKRVEIICQDGFDWIKNYDGPGFDLIFADAWPGKFYLLNETLDLLNTGGFYLIDDLAPQDNWPVGHIEKVESLIEELEGIESLQLTRINWSTGLILASKKTIK